MTPPNKLSPLPKSEATYNINSIQYPTAR